MGFFPPMTDERQALIRAQDDRRGGLLAFAEDHTCAECDGLLGIRKWWDGEPMLFCMTLNTHQGYRRLHSPSEAYRLGEYVSPYLEQIFERKGRKRMTGDLAKIDEAGMTARVDMARFPQQLTIDQKRMVVKVALTYGLDPLMGELTVYHGNPFISIDGRYRKARETGMLDGVETRPATVEERSAWGIEAGDYFFRCEVWRKDASRPFVGWGRIRAAETKGDSHLPLVAQPQRMAEKRAEAQALRKAFGIPLPSFGGEAEAPEILEVDAEPDEVIEGGSPEPQETPKDADPDAPIGEGEGEGDPPLAEPPLKNVNDLTRWAKERYGLDGRAVYQILGVKSSVEIGDLEAARAKVVASQEG